MKTKEEITKKLIEIIKEMPDESWTSTSRLLKEAGIETDERTDDLLEIHYDLFSAAEEENIYLDMSSHEGLDEGMPYNLEFQIFFDATLKELEDNK